MLGGGEDEMKRIFLHDGVVKVGLVSLFCLAGWLAGCLTPVAAFTFIFAFRGRQWAATSTDIAGEEP